MILSKLLALPMALFVAASAAGMDMDYEGEIDIVTGLPANSAVAEDTSSQQTVVLADGVTYDRNAHMFSYSTPDKTGYIRSSLADGMVTTSKVVVEIPSGVAVSLYHNGEMQTEMDAANIVEPGGYALVMTTAESQYQIMSFQIVQEKTGAISSYSMPDGFKLQALEVDGEAKDPTGISDVNMETDGRYRLTYRCNATGIDYNLNVTIDHTPPALELEGVTDSIAKGPVTVKGLAKTDTVQISRDGTLLQQPLLLSNVLKTPGDYKIVVTDDAGNTVAEEFRIRFYLNSQGLVFSLVAAAVIAGVIIYMYVSKKRLKVR